MTKNSSTISGILIGTIVSAIALYAVLHWTGWEALITSLENVAWGYFVLSMGVYLLSMAARALSWGSIMQNRFSFLQVMAALNEGYLLNNLLPWRLGEIGRALLLGRKPGMSVLGVLSTIVVERTYDMVFAIVLLAAMLPLAAGIPGVQQQVLFGAAAMIVVLAGLLIAVFRQEWIEWIVKRLPGDSSRWLGLWQRVREGLSIFRTGKGLVASLLWMALSWALAGFEYWFMLRAVLPQATLIMALFMLTITLLGVAIPSSPGYIGVFEAAGVLALSVFGVLRSDALAATLLLHGMVLVIASGLGAIALMVEGETLQALYADVRDWLKSEREINELA